ncbi:MAG: hypothetical protein QNI86_09010 [Halieaceae bacterium]|nr:hypothetical protein [Halieaceae bacterium]
MSVLLEALKKAALEKRTREESADAEGLPAPVLEASAGDLAEAEPAAPVAEEPVPLKAVVNTAAVDYLARQEAMRAPRAYEDIEQEAELKTQAAEPGPVPAIPDSKPDPAPEPEPDAVQDSATKLPEVAGSQRDDEDLEESPEALPGEHLEAAPAANDFSLPEPAVEAPELPAGVSASEELLAGLSFLHEHEHEHGHEEDLDLDLDVSAAAEFDALAAEPPAAPETEVNPAAAAAIDQDQQRRAMQQLIGRSREVLKRSKRRGTYMHAALLLTSVGAIGLYYWVLSQSGDLTTPEPMIMAGQGEAVVQPALPETVPAEAPGVSDTNASEPAVAAEASVPAEPPAASPVEKASVRDATPVAREPVALVEPVREARRERTESADASESRLLIERRQTPRPLARKVNDAYRAYQGGDLDHASRLYRQVLEEAPRQRDALLGVAAIAVQRGQYQEALRFYQRRLVDDSTDHFARAGLLALAGQGVADPELQSEVKILLDDYPQQAHLHFLLGSLQAAAGSWPEAQRSFFEARSWDRDNPDYAYNLAVSLEHLRQPTQALAQYRQALELAALTPPQFDTAVASRRVTYLETRQP